MRHSCCRSSPSTRTYSASANALSILRSGVGILPAVESTLENRKLEAYATLENRKLEAYATLENRKLEAYATLENRKLEAYATLDFWASGGARLPIPLDYLYCLLEYC